MEMKRALGIYVATLRHIPYVWGHMDCNLFIADWIDQTQDKNTAESIRGFYTNKRDAIVFAKRYMKAPEYLKINGYKVVEGDPKNCDILLQDLGHYYSASLVLNDKAYTYQEGKGLIHIDINQMSEYTIWRHDA